MAGRTSGSATRTRPLEAIAMWCRRALDSRVAPVLLCHALGKTEEMMLALRALRIRVCPGKALRAVRESYTGAGRPLPEWIELDGDARGRVVIAPACR